MKRLFWISLFATLGLMIGLMVLGAPLRTPLAPQGVVSFELAWSTASARAMLSSWSERQREILRISLLVDYAFLIAYPVTIFAALRLWATRFFARPHLSRAYRGLAMLQPIAGLMDALENFCLLQLLDGATGSHALIAGIAATIKVERALAHPRCAPRPPCVEGTLDGRPTAVRARDAALLSSSAWLGERPLQAPSARCTPSHAPPPTAVMNPPKRRPSVRPRSRAIPRITRGPFSPG